MKYLYYFKILVILVFCYLLIGCNSLKTKEIVNIEKSDYLTSVPKDSNIEYKSNLNSNIANGSYVVHDEEFIYYINNIDKKIYKINLNGQNKELLSDICADRLFLYNDEIYFIKIKMVGKLKVSEKICSIDKLGINLKTVVEADDILNFNIHNDIIYYNASANKTSEGVIPYEIHNLYSYNLYTKEKSIIYDDISCNVMSVGIHPIFIENEKIYFDVFVDEDIKMIEYDIKSSTVRSILNKTAIIDDNTMFFYSVFDKEKNLNKLCKLGIDENIDKAKDIYLANNNIYMRRIALTEKYLFLMYNEYKSIDDVKLNILRINCDENEIVKIAEYNSSATSSYFYGYIQLVNDKLIVYDYNYTKNPEYSITVIDFDGNILDWDM